jgi:hypothetical protein
VVITVAADLSHARLVKDDLSERLRSAPEVNGVGLVRRPDGWAVKVNLIRSAPNVRIPPVIDGVEIVTDVTGPIVAQ